MIMQRLDAFLRGARVRCMSMHGPWAFMHDRVA
jgi:hypothetical protein